MGTYPGKGGQPPKQALKYMSLLVERGVCLGLLGANGAGKTMLLSILSGVFPPTHGQAQIAGHDVETQIDKAHLAMGMCPQFNVLWDTLTVEEHVLFYSRLKGISSKEEKRHTLEVLTQFGLAPFAKRKAHQLSGGMARRLQVAISVFRDEPTTGVDPVSRRQLWDILNVAKA